MEFLVEIDSRESCHVLLNPAQFAELSTPYIGVLDGAETEKRYKAVLYVKEDKSVKKNFCRISKDFAACMGFSHGSTLIALPLRQDDITAPASAAPIVVSPNSTEDWEVIESQSELLEDVILGQIKILVSGMKFPIFLARGQRPVVLQVTGDAEGVRVLGVDTELAVEPRMKRDVLDLSDGAKNSGKSGALRVRIVDSCFPTDVEGIAGVGMIMNRADSISAFGADCGCIFTVRDRPEIVAICASDSSLVDPGVVLISNCLRDQYSLSAGDRIILEPLNEKLNPIVIPRSITVTAKCERRVIEKLFSEFVSLAGMVIVAQGGWIDVGNGEYVQIHFTCDVATKRPSHNIAAITAKTWDDILVTWKTIPTGDRHPTPRANKPHLKYVPESLQSLTCDIILDESQLNHHTPLPPTIIPSFVSISDRIAKFIESSFISAPVESPFVGSILLTSSSACGGKTTLIRQSLDALSPPIPYLLVDCMSLSSPSIFRLEEVKAVLSGVVRFAFECPPMVIVLDNVDSLIPLEIDSTEGTGDGAGLHASSESLVRRVKRGKVIAAFLERLLVELRPNRSIALIGTAVGDSPTLARLFVHHERLPPSLTAADIEYLVPPSFLATSDLSGYSLMELVEIRRTGRDNRQIRKQLLAGDVGKSILSHIPRLGGLGAQSRQLLDAVTLPLHFPYLFKSAGGKSLVSRGAFVVGPSGTGKSALIDYVVRTACLPVEIVRGPDLLDKYIGASEQGVRRVFEKAATIAPCVVVFDAIDALCPKRGNESTGVTDRVVNQMLCYLDGVEQMDNVFVIAVSSRPEIVDPALTRPGRLDLTVFCDIPNLEEKKEIVQVLWDEFVPSTTLTEESALSLGDSIHANCTGADIRGAFVNAEIFARRAKISVDMELISRCLKESKPSISDREIASRQFGKYSSSVTSESVGKRVMLH